MIIQCEQCQTKFRLDDSKVKEAGAKVRCARCKHVFVISNEQQENALPSDFGATFDHSEAHMVEDQPYDPFAHLDETPAPDTRDDFDLESSSFDMAEQKENTTTIDSTMFDLPEEEPPAVEEPVEESVHYDPENDLEPVLTAAEPPIQGSEINFDGFDFGDVPEYSASGADDSSAFPDLGETGSDASVPLDFGAQFNDFSGSSSTPRKAAGSESASAMSFDQPFNLGEIDFGDDLASLSSQQVNPDEVKGGLDFDFGHLDEPQETTSTYASGGGTPWIAPVAPVAPVAAVAAFAHQEPLPSTELTSDKIGMWGPWSLAVPELPGSAASEDLPPLSIASRRKQSSLITILVSAAAVFGMAAVIYMGGSHTQEEISSPTSQAAGKITLTSVDAAFVNNKSVGELLVISGSAVNNFETPRAALQLKGMVYGENDQVVASKNAYCGNTFTKEQLAVMPLETIETAMANQFGSTLDNMEVAPGKAIPCMVVISKLPEDSKNYGAVAAGSLPVTQKQKQTELPAKPKE